MSLLTIVLVCATVLFAQDFSQDIKEQVPVILKALNHNKTLDDKIRKNCIIAVLYNPQSATSETEKDAIVDVLNDNKKIKIHGKKLKTVEIPMEMSINLEKQVIIKKINAFWITSGLKPYMNIIRESAKYNQVITISSHNDLVNTSMVALGTQKTESGHKILLNMTEINNINVNINDNLLSEAIVIK
jgi:hypothetical protein